MLLMFASIFPRTAAALEIPSSPGNQPIVTLSAPDPVKEMLEKYIRLPAEPFASNYDELIFLHRVQQEIRDILATEGYFNPTVTTAQQAQTPAKTTVISIEPGELTRVGSVTIDFTGDIVNGDEKHRKRIEQLRAAWPLTTGQPFRSTDWEHAKSVLIDNLTEQAFATATITNSQASVDPGKARADLVVTIDSGPVFYFGSIQVTGLQRYETALVTRLAPFKAGDVYRRDLLHQYQIALQKAPQFSTVTISIAQDTAQHLAAPVQVALTEAQPQRFAFGAGYSSNNGARGEVNYRNYNFLDRAWNLTSLLRLEQKRQTFLAGIDTLPDQNSINHSLSASLQMTDIEGLKTDVQKVGVTRNYQTPKTVIQLGLNWQREHKKPDGAIDQVNKALVLDWRWRRLVVDNPVNVRRGDITEVRIGGGSQLLLSDQDFIRTYASHQSWWPVGSRDTFFLRAEVGYTLASSRFGIPQEYLFRAGGIQSVRGYDFKSIGVHEGSAVVGGRVMATGTAEYTHWLTQQWGAAAFADIGSAADRWQDMRMFLGYGAGVRWRSPAGPLALDLARGQETGTLRVHFSMAVAF
ncbi:MAG: BamA/TamA family outer membrane protein [Proteobacteria bacterium]|nr:BamA/TamA family outer membrane protein [Pseudomonadota bacterium]